LGASAVREFRDADGLKWVVFFTARSVARDHHLPEEYREGWLAFESSGGEKRRLAPVPRDWESLSDAELSRLCATAPLQAPRKRAAAPTADQVENRESAPAQEPESLRPQLRELETKLSAALDEVCDLAPPQKLDTGELIRVEETLALATEAAKEAVSLRRKLRADRDRKVRDGPSSRPQSDHA
jgi:hypothetical protein